MSLSPSRWPGFWIIVGFWTVVAFGNYPAPFIDDLFYIGTAFSMVKTGLYTNPYAETMSALGSGPGHLSLFYVPMESYVAAGWLQLFGIGTLPLRALFLLLAFMCSLLLYRLMPKVGPFWLAALVICLAIFGMLGGLGLRPDALGLFFLLLGLRIWAAPTPTMFFLRSFALALASITYLNVALSAVFLSLFGLTHLRLRQGKTIPELVPFVSATAVAWGLGFLLFLACIHGQLAGFLHSVALNSRMGASGVWWRFQLFTPFGIAKWVAVQAAFLAVILPRLWRDAKTPVLKEERLFLGFAVVVFLLLGYGAVTSASGSHLWAFACLLTLLYLGLREAWRWPAWLVYGFVFVVTAFGHDHSALQSLLANPMPPAEQRQALRHELEAANPKRLYLDAGAIRELYDYDLPANARDYEWASTSGWGAPRSLGELPNDALSVVSVGTALPGATVLGTAPEPKALRILGVSVPGAIANPYDLKVIDTR